MLTPNKIVPHRGWIFQNPKTYLLSLLLFFKNSELRRSVDQVRVHRET